MKKMKFTKISGPCAVESYEQMIKTAQAIRENIDILRGGAFKPRTDPKSFQGLGEDGLRILNRVGKKIGRPIITEVLDTRHVSLVCKYSDYLQIGARNMHNFELLKEVGKTRKTVVLKRGLAATVSEWIMASKYISAGGSNVILCERGIRTYEDSTRFTLDLTGAMVAKIESGLPVLIDPSHATGRKDLILSMVKATYAAGFDGVMIESHFCPSSAICDANQALKPDEYNSIINNLLYGNTNG
jgi:3-deoxy-7-phosphoheptulonate synthase